MSEEKKDINLVELKFSADRAAFDAEVTKVFTKRNKNITVPGFRKGKAPRAFVEKMYGKEAFYDDAINALLPDLYEKALSEQEYTPVSRPDFEVTEINDEGVFITAKFYRKPDVEIADYKGIAVERAVAPISDDAVDHEIGHARERNSRRVDVTDRPAAMDDTVIFDFDGYVDGVQFEGGKGESYSLKLGSGQFIPGFEEQICGHSVGDAFDVDVTFPEDYHAEELKGKPAVFKCVLHEIKFDELPALDDEFAKDVSEFDTLDEYKADVRAKLQKTNEENADKVVEEKLIDALLEKMTAEVPAAMIDAECDNMLRDYDTRMRSQGLSIDAYLQYTGSTIESMKENFRPGAERQVKTRLALEKIVELEKIEIPAEEVEAEYKSLSDAYGMEIDKIKELVDDKQISADLAVKKAVELVKASAKITDKAPEEKAPAKKAPAKKAAPKTTEKKTKTTKKATEPKAE